MTLRTSHTALSHSLCRQGTIFDVQRVLKRDHASCLDKYRVKGAVRWKTAVRVSDGVQSAVAACWTAGNCCACIS